MLADGGLFDIFPDPFGPAAQTCFVSPFAGGGVQIAPARTEAALKVPSWSPIAASKHGRTIDLSPSNATRWRHAALPPSDAVLRAYEDEAFAAATTWIAEQGL